MSKRIPLKPHVSSLVPKGKSISMSMEEIKSGVEATCVKVRSTSIKGVESHIAGFI